MKTLFRPFLFAVIALSLLAGCGSKEPQERAAFIEFLQKRIVDHRGIGVPQLTEAEKQSFGDYAAHYAVIIDFNRDMDGAIKPLDGVMKRSMVRSLGDAMTGEESIRTARAMLADIAKTSEAALAKAEAARGKLQQPEDLKTVYDAAYQKTVAGPAGGFKEVLPMLDTTLESLLKLTEFIQKNKNKVQISGAMVKVTDPAIQTELNKLVQDVEKQARALQVAQQQLQRVLMGQ